MKPRCRFALHCGSNKAALARPACRPLIVIAVELGGVACSDLLGYEGGQLAVQDSGPDNGAFDSKVDSPDSNTSTDTGIVGDGGNASSGGDLSGSDPSDGGDLNTDSGVVDAEVTHEDADTSEDPLTSSVAQLSTTEPSTSNADAGDSTHETSGQTSDAAIVHSLCGTFDLTNAHVVNEPIDADTVWSGTIYIPTRVAVVDLATVTIAAGTRIIMGVDSGLDFAWQGESATLFADGTPSEPIKICGELESPGSWGSLSFGEFVTSNSRLDNVLIADGGADGAALKIQSAIHVNDVTVVNSEEAGVEAVGFAEDSAGLSVRGTGGGPAVLLTGSDAVAHFPAGGQFEDNDNNEIVIAFDSIGGRDTVTFANFGVPYVQERQLRVLETATVVFDAGVVYRFAPDASLEIGWNSSEVTFFINGTEAQPVTFEGQVSTPGYWQGLIVRTNVHTNSIINHLILRDAGGGEDQAALKVESPIALIDVTLEANEAGLVVSEYGLADTSKNLKITGTQGTPVTVDANALGSLPSTDSSYTGNVDDAIVIVGGRIDTSGAVRNLGVPYRVTEEVDVVDGTSMTIEPGVTFEMRPTTSIEFGWNGGEAEIIAEGTEDDPIVFTGTDQTPGSWAGLYVGSDVLPTSRFEHVIVQYAGNESAPNEGAGLYLSSPVTVSQCQFNDIAGYGVFAENPADAALVSDSTTSGSTLGLVAP